jgi:methylisocitrate lyase
MSNKNSPGQRFRDAVASEHPLQVVGAINANHALLAKRAGFKAIYLSGGGVAAGRWACRTWASPAWMMY